MKHILLASVLSMPVMLSDAPATAAPSAPLWKACAQQPQAQCGTVEVPLSWSEPGGPKIKLAVTRRTATDPQARVGTLFFNPGGPGTGAASLVRDYPSTFFSEELRRRFDIVGIDPRGVGESSMVRCGMPVYDPQTTQFPTTFTAYRRMVARNQAVGESCRSATGPLLGHIDTKSVARDFDAVRAALGESKVSFLGKSYGTMLGAQYAQLFPHRVRSMALDGALDHGLSTDRLVRDAAIAVEDSFEQFATWCARTTTCALHGREVGRVWDELITRAERAPIPVKGGRAVTAEELRYLAYAMLNFLPEFGGGLATAIVQAGQGDAQLFATMRGQVMEDAARTAAYRSILCLDIDPRIDGYRSLRSRLEQVRRLSPHLGGTSEFWDMTAGCVGWPIAPTNPQRRVGVRGTPPILVVGNTHDPATPLRWARSLASRIHGAGLLVNDVTGHTAHMRSACATRHIDRYLITGQLPSRGTTC